MCAVVGTLGNDEVQFSCASFASAFAGAAAFFFDERSAGFLLSALASDLGVTCFTSAGIVGEPLLFGGAGGFEEECRL